MRANPDFQNKDLEFWANIRFLGQYIGYTVRRKKGEDEPNPPYKVPTVEEVKTKFAEFGLDHSKLVAGNEWTEYGRSLIGYINYRGECLVNHIKPNLMNKDEAKKLYESELDRIKPPAPLIPMNKQKGDKAKVNYLTALVNMNIWNELDGVGFDHNPRELTTIVEGGVPIRTMSRWMDGAFPAIHNPIAVWEIKEYYHTTTFGSRVADGVYESQLDGFELEEINENLGRNVEHLLMIDAYLTWWDMGKSYLCRIVDMLHMGFVDEVLFGREVVVEIPGIVQRWKGLMPNDGGNGGQLFD